MRTLLAGHPASSVLRVAWLDLLDLDRSGSAIYKSGSKAAESLELKGMAYSVER